MLALLDFANEWVERGGLAVLTLIIFAETGLLVGFFLPGDSLLFFAGFLSSTGVLPPIQWVSLASVLAAVVGDQVGYSIGRKFGPSLINRPRSRFFDPANVRR
ncbi:MAG: DedA family protein, partial [Ilumatobacteraceae bacterium]